MFIFVFIFLLNKAMPQAVGCLPSCYGLSFQPFLASLSPIHFPGSTYTVKDPPLSLCLGPRSPPPGPSCCQAHKVAIKLTDFRWGRCDSRLHGNQIINKEAGSGQSIHCPCSPSAVSAPQGSYTERVSKAFPKIQLGIIEWTIVGLETQWLI